MFKINVCVPHMQGTKESGISMSSSSSSMEHAESTNITSSSEDETLRLHNRDAWLRRKIKCMCDRCRGCFYRARRITMSHLSRYGEWDKEKNPVIFITLFAQILLVYIASLPLNKISFFDWAGCRATSSNGPSRASRCCEASTRGGRVLKKSRD